MVLSASPNSLTRSSLEEMLDSLRRKDEEEEKNKDLPPALPSRPASKARLPPARRSLPNNFKVGSGLNDNVEKSKRKEISMSTTTTTRRESMSSFGRKRVKKDAAVESPYAKFDCDTLSYFIKMKLRVWCRQPRGQWELGSIQSTSGEEASVLFSSGKVLKVARSELVPANPDILEVADDLIKLAYLNEPSVLHNLRFRYSREMIYSKAGPVLIALNPFKDLQMYGNDYVSTYRRRLVDGPHVYGIVEAAYNQMMRDEVNQSIIISGESGSGKTETAKIAMQYLAALGSGNCGRAKDVLQTNCILEAFGNAKTSVNDNSSRFGKFIEIHFSATGKICGANIQTYLLEKSRVVQLASGERSYHVFYQLCAGSSSSLKERLNLRAACEYKYLNQSDCMTIGGIDDAKNFHQLMKAFDAVRICKEDQEMILKMLATILWLGNISFKVTDSENHIEVVGDEAVTSAALLMDCSCQDLMSALSIKKIQSDQDIDSKSLTLLQAIETRDAIAKFIYSSLFEWLVQQVNKSLEVGENHTEKCISILDICGFQSFQKNSFEQLCINYANERLQQHFNRHLFKLEQEDYESDGIDCTVLDFEDNQECLDLFEKKPLSLLSLLDEESDFPEASDLTFANKLKNLLNANHCFKEESGRAFSVRHYAGEVLYDTNGFLEKNRDALSSNSIQLLSSSNCELLKLFSEVFNQSEEHGNSTFHVGAPYSQKIGIGTKFKDQLFKLMHQLECTTPHFIRCIKPNTKKLPGIYDNELVLQQLRCCGLLEAVRISRAGYPTRINHQDFSRRYGILLSETDVPKDPLSTTVAVLQKFNIPSEMYQVGYPKLYLRAGQIGALEDKRKQFSQATVGIQKCFRGHQVRSYFCELKNGVTTLQSFIRGEVTRRKHGVLTKSSITVYSKKLEEIHAVILLQSVIRGWKVRRDSSNINKWRKYHENAQPRRKSRVKIPEVKDLSNELVQNRPSTLSELQKRVYRAEAIIEKKEDENTELREKLKQSERKRVEYEAKMKSMEDAWQKQMASLQEQFEAPMWVDLIVEANSGYENITDDDWFNESHPFHQLSARELKSKFAHSGEEAVASPALPSSVSKSRGKHYNNKNWGKGINLNVLLDKQQGLSKGRCLKQGSSFGYEGKVKSMSNVSRTKGLMSEKSGLTFEHNTRGKAMSKASCNLVGSSSSMDKKNYERSTRSMVTSESMLQKKDYKGHKKVSCDEKSKSSSVRSVSFGRSAITIEASRVQDKHKYMEVSSKPCDLKSGNSSVSSISLGKSHVTPKVSKVEMDVGNMKFRGRKSSSGKSSVGSCSNPSYEAKFVSKQQREKITDKNRCNPGNKSKTSSITAEGKGKGIIIGGSNINVAKSLVKSQSVSSSTMLQGKVNKKNSTIGKKEAFDKGKENATRKLTVNKNCNEEGVLARGILKSQKTREHNRQHKDDKAGSAALTILGKINDQCEAKKPGNPARRIYLR